IEQCEKYGVYLNFINRYIENFRANSIGLDNIDAGSQAADYFFKKGCSIFSFVGNEEGSMTCEERWQSFSQRAVELGLDKPIRISGSFDMESGISAVRD
ncbi:transcriptional regulator, partial [Vibrio sp. 10N.222.55.E8]